MASSGAATCPCGPHFSSCSAIFQALYLLHTTSVDKVLYMKIDRLDETNTMEQSKFHSEVVSENSFFVGPTFLVLCVKTSLGHILPLGTPNSACRLSLNMILTIEHHYADKSSVGALLQKVDFGPFH